MSKRLSLLITLYFLSGSSIALAQGPQIYKKDQINYTQASELPQGAKRAVIFGNLSKPEPYILRHNVPAGYVALPHWHDTDEQVTILSGSLHVGFGKVFDKSKTITLRPGDFQIIPAYTPHYGYATEPALYQNSGMGPRTTKFEDQKAWDKVVAESYKKSASLY